MTQRAQTYHGKPCRKCGSTERYIAQGNCIACNIASRRAAALAHPERTQRADREHKARVRSTYYLLYHEQDFDRRGWRQASIASPAY